MKRCVRCSEFKPACEFYSGPTHSDGLTKRCKPCHIAHSNECRRRNVAGTMLHSVRANAKQRGIPFTLTAEDIRVPRLCPVFGMPLRKAVGRMDDNSPSLDRLDSSQGYVPGNVRVISWKANRLKSNATLVDLQKIVQWLEVQ